MIYRHWITEKSSRLSQEGAYTFVVEKSANKSEVKKFVERRYKVNVKSVHIVNAKAKQRRFGKSTGSVPGFKKAIVTLQKGQKIDFVTA